MRTAEIGTIAASLMESLEEYFEEADMRVGVVSVIVEGVSDDHTALYYRCSDSRKWVQRGLFHEAMMAVDEA